MSGEEIVNAINDLTRVTIAIHGKFESKSEAVRTLSELLIPTSRIGAILAMNPKDVASIVARTKKTSGRVKK